MIGVAPLVSASGLALVGGAWIRYLALIPREAVPRRPRGFMALMISGALGAAAAIASAVALNDSADVLAITATISTVTVGLALFFFYLLSQAPLPDGTLRVKVGDAFPAFEAVDARGVKVRWEDLRGKRLLFKFFRGHW